MSDGRPGSSAPDGGIGAVVTASAQNLGRVGLHRDAVAAVGGRAMEPRRDRADASRGHCAQQGGEGEPGAAVLGRGVGAVVADVRDAQIVGARGIARIDPVELRPPLDGAPGPWSPFSGWYGAAVVTMVTDAEASGLRSGVNGASMWCAQR